MVVAAASSPTRLGPRPPDTWTARRNIATMKILVDLCNEGAVPNLITGGAERVVPRRVAPATTPRSIDPWIQGVWSSKYYDFEPIYAPIPAGDGGSMSVVGERTSSHPTSKPQGGRREEHRLTRRSSRRLAMTNRSDDGDPLARQQMSNGRRLLLAPSQIAARRPIAVREPECGQIDAALRRDLAPAFLQKLAAGRAQQGRRRDRRASCGRKVRPETSITSRKGWSAAHQPSPHTASQSRGRPTRQGSPFKPSAARPLPTCSSRRESYLLVSNLYPACRRSR